MKRIFTILLAGISLITSAQERCGAEAHAKNMMNNNPSYAIARDKVNAQTEKWIENNPNHSEKTIITIPVVVHVVWETNTQNISDAQILSQIDVLNEDFRRTNVDQINTPNVWTSIATDSEIEFCLATTDPNGNTTTGIERTQTTHGEFGMDSDIHTASAGGADDWPNDDYLNIWVCNIQSGLLGYASPPSNWVGDGDGLVIGYRYFGRTGTLQSPYNKGRTVTHEVGHWLNLDHVWGAWGSCGNDQVADTPKQETENYSCPAFPLNPNACSTTNANGDMFMNYMDYTNDACMNLFTNGQKDRMLAAINLYRSNMVTNNCDGSVGISEQKNNKKKLIKIVDVLGRTSTEKQTNTPLFYIYDNGSVEKKIIIE
ncbi:MAG: zinc metalloprotease [Cryomorphaceae bacterium]|nr:zinc metalloprotease [Cryomorphaceae bacterium]